jgi:hypothetical protein
VSATVTDAIAELAAPFTVIGTPTRMARLGFGCLAQAGTYLALLLF